jgi:hypothetical protein
LADPNKVESTNGGQAKNWWSRREKKEGGKIEVKGYCFLPPKFYNLCQILIVKINQVSKSKN